MLIVIGRGRVGLEEDVGVVIDQSRQHGGMAEIDDTGSGGRGDIGADLSDALAVDQDVLVGEHPAATNIDQFAGLDEDLFLVLGGGTAALGENRGCR